MMKHLAWLLPEPVAESELHRCQIQEIREGLAEADREEFATDSEVAEVLKRWAGRDH